MPSINSKVQSRFNKRFMRNDFVNSLMEKYPVLAEIIKSEMQEMYDLGHADGYAEAIMTYNNLEEENGNL